MRSYWYLFSEVNLDTATAVRVTDKKWRQALELRTFLALTGSPIPRLDMIITGLWASDRNVQLSPMKEMIATHQFAGTLVGPEELVWYMRGNLVGWLLFLLDYGTVQVFWSVDEKLYDLNRVI